MDSVAIGKTAGLSVGDAVRNAVRDAVAVAVGLLADAVGEVSDAVAVDVAVGGGSVRYRNCIVVLGETGASCDRLLRISR